MGVKGIARFLAHRAFEGLVLALIFTFLPNIPPFTSISQPFKVTPAKPFEGKLALNNKLDDVEIWHKGDFLGPEALADYDGELYTSLYGGDVVKLTGDNHITPVIKTGKPCKPHQESLCGRPLGLQFDQNGNLYVVDAYYGIFKVNVKTGEKQLVIDVNKEIEGKKPKLPNSIALASNGDFYWSDSSTEFTLEDGLFDMLADPSGRLIHYDSKTKKNTVLINKLHFANGVALSDDEEFVLVNDIVRNRIQRYYLKGPKKGTSDIFIDGLPGFPDNLKSVGKHGFLVPIVTATDADHPNIVQVIGPFPWLRRLISRCLAVTKYGFVYLNKVYPSEFAEKAIHFIGHFSSIVGLVTPPRVTILHVSKTGEILDSIHSLNKKIAFISEAHIFQDQLVLGSPYNNYLARIPLSKIGWSHLKQEERKKREVPVEKPTPKPTQAPTTTQKPTTTPPPSKAPTTTTTPPPPRTTQAPPPKQTLPPKEKKPEAAPPKETTPPPKQQTPPPKQQTPPPKQQTPPPPKQQTPPPKQQTPPPKQQTPPPKQQTPPPKQQTPPPKQQTQPPKQAPPPVQKQ